MTYMNSFHIVFTYAGRSVVRSVGRSVGRSFVYCLY
jgi:hypothetical protein